MTSFTFSNTLQQAHKDCSPCVSASLSLQPLPARLLQPFYLEVKTSEAKENTKRTLTKLLEYEFTLGIIIYPLLQGV
jgi:hypothetical protein